MWANINNLPILVGQDICGEHGAQAHICANQWTTIPTRREMDLFLIVAAGATPAVKGINVDPNVPILKDTALILFADGMHGLSYAYRACDRPHPIYDQQRKPIRIDANRQVDDVILDIIYYTQRLPLLAPCV